MDSKKEFQTRVNPVYTTGKGTAGCLAQAGNRDAAAIVGKMDLSELPSKGNIPDIIRKGYAVALDARFGISNEMIRRENKPYVVDLPCGYTPRSLSMAREGKHYIGFDLPVVADEIGAIVKGLIPDDLSALVEYHGVDATNYDSMRRHLDQVKGEVCIATDGLLGYFNESELNSMCVNIKRILREFGGSWITGDMTNEVIFGATFGILLKSNPEALQTFSMNTASQMADVAMKQNSLFSGGTQKAVEYLQGVGFQVEKSSYADLMPSLVSMADNPEIEKELREAYRSIEMWKMTLSRDKEETKEEVEAKDFGAELSLAGDHLDVALSGRLDTITAPELLEKFESITKDRTVASVTIDNQNLQYISSAGLRVMLIIYKALKNKENFRMMNVSAEVKEILEVTGFDQFLLGEAQD